MSKSIQQANAKALAQLDGMGEDETVIVYGHSGATTRSAVSFSGAMEVRRARDVIEAATCPFSVVKA